MTDHDDLDSIVDEARERIAASRAATEADQARIRDLAHHAHVTWGYPDEEDWRRRA